jgi:hypothetical protein
MSVVWSIHREEKFGVVLEVVLNQTTWLACWAHISPRRVLAVFLGRMRTKMVRKMGVAWAWDDCYESAELVALEVVVLIYTSMP